MVTLQNLCDLYPTLLDDNLVMPEGLSAETMKSVIMMRLGLCYPAYTEPEVFASMLYSWCASHKWNIERLIAVTGIEYAPLENYDRREDFTDLNTGGSTTNDTNTNTADRTDTNINTADRIFKTDTETSGSTTSETDTTSSNTNTVSAYNSTNFENDSKSDGTGSSDTDTTSITDLDEIKKETGTYTDARTITGTITDARVIEVSNNGNVNHSGRAHGNIGTMTTQSMFSQELALLNGYNLYYTICNWIERDLFIQVY